MKASLLAPLLNAYEIKRFWSNAKPAALTGCLEWQLGKSAKGYGIFYVPSRISHGAKDHANNVHRVAYWLARGPFDDTLHVLHHCDNPACINPDHLFLGTNDDNVRDAILKGRRPYKLAPSDIRDIRASKDNGMTLARRYKVSSGYLYKILRGERRVHRDSPPGPPPIHAHERYHAHEK